MKSRAKASITIIECFRCMTGKCAVAAGVALQMNQVVIQARRHRRCRQLLNMPCLVWYVAFSSIIINLLYHIFYWVHTSNYLICQLCGLSYTKQALDWRRQKKCFNTFIVLQLFSQGSWYLPFVLSMEHIGITKRFGPLTEAAHLLSQICPPHKQTVCTIAGLLFALMGKIFVK